MEYNLIGAQNLPSHCVHGCSEGDLCRLHPNLKDFRDTFFNIKMKLKSALTRRRFMNNLQPKIKQVINCKEIRQYPLLVNGCRILSKDNRARVVHYQSMDPMKDEKFSN
ncbi:hypothetical protein CR513_03303, partial [Mucuna pruriens]